MASRDPQRPEPPRRTFFKQGAIGGAGLFLGSGLGESTAPGKGETDDERLPDPVAMPPAAAPLDLSPARWIWYPSERTLPNTFVLFRRPLTLPAAPVQARGWIAADSRYLLAVNGERVQWGPAPADPRWQEADPVDLTRALTAGDNVLGATVLYYGHGEGTWPAGKPGFLFRLDVELEDGRALQVVSDDAWQAHLALSWPPGQYKRWFLRALQETFDARRHPYGWDAPGFAPDGDWLPAMTLDGPAHRPSICTDYYEYLSGTGVQDPEATQLRPRSVPLLAESTVAAAALESATWIEWLRPPDEYFIARTPGAYRAAGADAARRTPAGWRVDLDGDATAALTFTFEEQIVGWPYFTIEAPEGTVVELMVHEAHAADGPALLNTHFNAWARFVCREGTNRFETFDFESLRWLQLHVRDARGRVTVRDVGVRRLRFPWPHRPAITCSDERVAKLFEAAVNTMNNAAQETLVDGMGRERQQYSGDCGHQLHALYHGFGETGLAARYLATFSQGLTRDGYFLDCWPAYDRLARIAQRQMGLTQWGPLLDHGVGFNFDGWHHVLHTGDVAALDEVFPRLLRFARYLDGLPRDDGLLPVEDLGVPTVWMDHSAYRRQRHKQCAFNLYTAAMAEHALAPLCHTLGHDDWAARADAFGRSLRRAAVRRFWSPERGVFVNNRPWVDDEGEVRMCDRSLATAVLFDQCPDGRTGPAVAVLAEAPPEMGLSYPANAGWRLWALAEGGRPDAVLRELRTRWWDMASVHHNNTLQEDWYAAPDGRAQWSHCPVAPLYVPYMSLAGIRPTAPAFARYEVRPQPGDLERLALTSQTVHGPLRFDVEGAAGGRTLTLHTPPVARGALLLDPREQVDLPRAPGADRAGLRAYRLPRDAGVRLSLHYT